ncbi:hypothetical protein [Flavobacterium sp.]|uniref:hypothetical protein n=1 Tax=Flavobacterium sp. TaxID=239 RepID=UPI0037520696
MKTLKFILLVHFVLLTFSSVSAQYGGYGGNGSYSNTGMGRPQSIQSDSDRHKKTDEQIEKEKQESIDRNVEKLKTDLKLDELQVIVIKKEIESSSKSIYKIFKSEDSDDEKTKQIEAVSEKTDRIINTFLNEEQKVIYKKIIEEKQERMEKLKDKRLR